MTEVIVAKRVSWQGTTYDSQLEADWAATLQSWGIAVRHHPGSVWLEEGQCRWEPDFITVPLETGEVPVLLEVKGPAGDRLWKAEMAERQYGEPVVVLRPGLVLPGSQNETAGATWHGVREWGAEWVVEMRANGTGVKFTREPAVDMLIRVSAERCITRPEVTGIGMRKALSDGMRAYL